MMMQKAFRKAIVRAKLENKFSQAKKKVFKYSQDQYQKSEQLMQFQLPQHRFRSKYSFLNNQTVPSDAIDLNLQNLNLKCLKDTQDFNKIPKLAHGLNKFLKGQLVEHDNGLGDIPQNVSDEVFDQMSQYRSPKNDKDLINLARENQCKYFSSTSNISTALIQIYYMFSMFRRPNFQNIFEGCPDQPRIHMVSFRKPITYVLSQVQKGLYSIQSDKGFLVPSNFVLTKLGTLGEYFLTHQKQDIKRLQQQLIVAQQKNYYRYSVANNNLFLRSQIDCHDYDQTTGRPFVFEIKTRACAPIRYDVERYQEYMDYPIDKKQGKFESFQRQYYDLIRGGFIKYAFQLKIGRMDGAFIAYHNTKKIYGYQYVKLKEIITRLFGDQFNFDNTFLIITRLLTEINDYIINDLKGKYDASQLKIGMYANACNRSLMVMVEVMDQIKEYKPVKLPGENAFYDVVNNMQLNPNIFRYEFSFFAFLNGVLYRQPDIYFEPNDQIEIKMAVNRQGKLHKIQYMSFLQEAYKIDSFFGNFRYNGMWGKF